MKNKTTKAFTLIELLVVIAIIGLLAGAISVSFSAARKKARDARRLSDLKAIRTAIVLYRDTNNKFPGCGGTYINGVNDCLTNALTSGGFIKKVPTDPKFAGKGWGNDYQYWGSNTYFNLRGRFEDTPVRQTHDYPGGATCDSGVYPTANWYQDVVYRGYGPKCALTFQQGSQ